MNRYRNNNNSTNLRLGNHSKSTVFTVKKKGCQPTLATHRECIACIYSLVKHILCIAWVSKY